MYALLMFEIAFVSDTLCYKITDRLGCSMVCYVQLYTELVVCTFIACKVEYSTVGSVSYTFPIVLL